MPTKLHELLAVQGNTSGQASKTRGELKNTFEKKRHLFEGRRKSFTPFGEDDGLTAIEEVQEIQSTVASEIQWVSGYLAKAVDVAYQVDLANTGARADVLLENGSILVKNIPATTLLQLEKRIVEWKELIEAIPTLDPAKGFVADPEHGVGHYKAREVKKMRTKKIKDVLTLAPATDKHPAQAVMIDVDKDTGTILEQEWSAMLTPAKKAELLDRVEGIFRAVSSARSKANEHAIEVKDNKIGVELLKYVFEPLHYA